MTSECIIYQSVIVNGRPYQQLSCLILEGLSTKETTINTDAGKLYGSLILSGGVYTLSLYKDLTRSQLVCSGTATSIGEMTLSEENDSGLSGSVYLIGYSADDASIEVVAFVSRDIDLPMANLEGLADYDQTAGFARYHLLAWQYLREFLISRYKSLLFNPDYIDPRSLNSAKGGYDLSRVLRISKLREASAHWAFSRLAEKQAIEPDGIFARRAADSRKLVKAHLETLELEFDTNQDRVAEK